MTVTVASGEMPTADLSPYLPLLARLRNGARRQPDWSALVDDAVQVWARPGFDTFLAAPRLRFEPFDYQRGPRRRCCAACEAGRSWPTRSGWARPSRPAWSSPSCACGAWPTAALVVTPAGLVEQWRDELERKFGLPTAIARPDEAGSRTRTRPAGAAGLAGRGAPGPAEEPSSPEAGGIWWSRTRHTGCESATARRGSSLASSVPGTCCC